MTDGDLPGDRSETGGDTGPSAGDTGPATTSGTGPDRADRSGSGTDQAAIGPDEGRSRGRRRWRARGALVVATVVALTTVAYGRWVGWAPADSYTEADAVVVHAGQRHRLRRATQLMAEGVAPVLVLLFAEATYDEADELCVDNDDYRVLCVDADRADTLGEAVEIGELAEEYGWESVVAVTSDYHLRRAIYLDRKCSDATIYGEGARPRNLYVQLRATASEMVAMPIALFSSCR